MHSGTILDRVASLCDEMLRRGVPLPVVQPVIDWVYAQRHPELNRGKE